MNYFRFLAWILAVHCLAVLAPVQASQEEIHGQLREAAISHRFRLDYTGQRFSGPAWNLLLDEASRAQFLLWGEEHGVAENPALAAALFSELVEHGYSRVIIEVSPPMAEELDRVLLEDGLDGLRSLYARPGGEPAFYGMNEEAHLLDHVRSQIAEGQVLWGVDYEVGSDRHLLRLLDEMSMPESARSALDRLIAASAESWARYAETGNPQFIFSFSGDPSLVEALSSVWSDRDEQADRILTTLEETLRINQFWVSGQAWQSNARRAELLRNNFLREWRSQQRAGQSPRALVKLGASHLVRGRNMTDTFDLGSLLHEIAELEGRSAFSVLVLPGSDREVAQFNPVAWSYQPAAPGSGYHDGLEPIVSAAFEDSFTLIDVRPLRSIIGMRDVPADLSRIVFGFDAVLVMSGSTASVEFEHPDHSRD
jgi:hypothetical protein